MTTTPDARESGRAGFMHYRLRHTPRGRHKRAWVIEARTREGGYVVAYGPVRLGRALQYVRILADGRRR